jgi:alpha-glutamyl/putrescinyl thymine pyrophosphorylase-like protein
MPTFCRHNRFIERCPICSKTLPGHSSSARPPRARTAVPSGAGGSATGSRRTRAQSVRVQREGRAEDDGYRSELVPGLRASADAHRLAEEIAFSSARLLALETAPPGLYGEARTIATSDLERATWMCFLIAYLSPLEQDDPFLGIRLAVAAAPTPGAEGSGESGSAEPEGPVARSTLPDLAEVPLGLHSSHDAARHSDTLVAYQQWVRRAGGTQAVAFAGDPAWSPERRFARVFERLALPGFARMGRYDLLVTLGRLGLYELRPDSLHLAGARGLSAEDLTTLGAKRVFGIGDPLLLERRAAVLARAASVPVEALDLALANWASPRRATLGFPPQSDDGDARARALHALGL